MIVYVLMESGGETDFNYWRLDYAVQDEAIAKMWVQQYPRLRTYVPVKVIDRLEEQ